MMGGGGGGGDDVVGRYEGASRTSSVMGLGFVAASTEDMAQSLIGANVVPLLKDVLVQVGVRSVPAKRSACRCSVN